MQQHTGERERNYACDHCPNKFTKKATLKHHQLIHTNEKPHSCPICQRLFRLKDTLKTHMKVHAKDD